VEALTRKGELAARDIAPLLLGIAGVAMVGLVIGVTPSPSWSAGYAVAVLGLGAAAVLGMLTAGGAAWPVAVVLWLVFLGAAAGGRLLDRLFSGGGAPIGLERATFGLALAFGLASHAMLALGLLGLLHAWLVAAVLLGLSALVRGDLLAIGRDGWRGVVGVWSSRATIPEPWFRLPLLALLVAWTVLVLIETLPPEIFYDAANYHLALPDLYAEQHRIVPTPYRIHSYLSLGTEMLYLLALLLGGESAARLTSLAFGILTALGMFAFARQWLSARAGLLAAALFATTPLVAWEASVAFVDLALSAYGFFAVAAAHRWLGDRRPAWLILAGLMAGFALSAKLNALLSPRRAGAGPTARRPSRPRSGLAGPLPGPAELRRRGPAQRGALAAVPLGPNRQPGLPVLQSPVPEPARTGRLRPLELGRAQHRHESRQPAAATLGDDLRKRRGVQRRSAERHPRARAAGGATARRRPLGAA